MAITRVVDTDDSGSGTTGTIHNNAWLQTLFDAIELNWVFDTYTPAWTSSGVAPAIGSGSIAGAYMKIGKLITGYIVLTPTAAGTPTTFGTGNYSFSIPVSNTAGPIMGIAEAFDSGTGDFHGVLRAATATTFQVLTASGASTVWGQTSPMTWATADSARFWFMYRA